MIALPEKHRQPTLSFLISLFDLKKEIIVFIKNCSIKRFSLMHLGQSIEDQSIEVFKRLIQLLKKLEKS